MDGVAIFGLFGLVGMSVLLIVMGVLSRRLGDVTKATPYYYGFFLASALVAIGIGARLYHISSEVAIIDNLQDNIGWVLLFNGAPALGMTIGLVIAWRYWSWLLAERN